MSFLASFFDTFCCQMLTQFHVVIKLLALLVQGSGEFMIVLLNDCKKIVVPILEFA